MNELLNKGKRLFSTPQNTIFSAAGIIMFMVIASRVLGFIRQRVLFSFFPPEVTDLYIAAFELPDLMFEVFVTGMLSAAFIPIFTKYLNKKGKMRAWEVVNAALSLLLVVFFAFSVIVFVFAGPIYHVLAGEGFKSFLGLDGGFNDSQITQVIFLSRLLILGQFFFLVSTFFTGILESQKRFLIPAVAPLFYNLGIIFSTMLFAKQIGLLAPVLGAIFGAGLHLLIQLPFVLDLGYRPKLFWKPKDQGVIELAKLAAPRVLEVSLFQIKRFVWLFLASIATGGVTYLKSADLLQALPVGVFGISLAKAAFPSLAKEYASNNMDEFRKIFNSTLNQVLFFVIPISAFMIVLRVPIVRLVFGAQQYSWIDTIQTGYVLSAFAFGIFAYAASLVFSRGFYALHDTKTPVLLSFISVLINAVLGFVFIVGMKLDTWGIALSFSIAGIVQFFLLITVFYAKIKAKVSNIFVPLFKMVLLSSFAGTIMFLILKVFDRAVWVKRLSFLGTIEASKYIPFESFVLDTRYTFNLAILTIVVFVLGFLIYFSLALLLKMQEAKNTLKILPRFASRPAFSDIPKEPEQLSPPPTDVQTN